MSETNKLDLREMRRRAEEAGSSDLETTVAAARVVSPERLAERSENFTVRYTDPDGVVHQDKLVSEIRNADSRNSASRMCAMLSGGPWGNLPPREQSRIYGLSMIATQLKDIPAWLNKWAQEDDLLLVKIVVVLEGHEARYFRRDVREGHGDSTGESVELVFADDSPLNPKLGASEQAEPVTG